MTRLIAGTQLIGYIAEKTGGVNQIQASPAELYQLYSGGSMSSTLAAASASVLAVKGLSALVAKTDLYNDLSQIAKYGPIDDMLDESKKEHKRLPVTFSKGWSYESID